MSSLHRFRELPEGAPEGAYLDDERHVRDKHGQLIRRVKDGCGLKWIPVSKDRRDHAQIHHHQYSNDALGRAEHAPRAPKYWESDYVPATIAEPGLKVNSVKKAKSDLKARRSEFVELRALRAIAREQDPIVSVELVGRSWEYFQLMAQAAMLRRNDNGDTAVANWGRAAELADIDSHEERVRVTLFTRKELLKIVGRKFPTTEARPGMTREGFKAVQKMIRDRYKK